MGQGTTNNSPTSSSARIVAGIGCRRGTDPDEIVALVHQCLAEAGASIDRLAVIASHVSKGDDPALAAAAAALGVPLCLFQDTDLAAAVPNPSSVVQRHTGLFSIAEACALAAGPLLLPKRATPRATCALALCAPGWQIQHLAPGAAQPSSAATHSSTSATS
jgi:cobalt-precorrin 5A hydrolase/precorrin-3B C17-methyltransferase